MKRALICGISGQDGGYLARFLLQHGYAVHGTTRAQSGAAEGSERSAGGKASARSLGLLKIADQVTLHCLAMDDFQSVQAVLAQVEPHEVYNLAGQSSVGLSFAQPLETVQSIVQGTLHLLEAIRLGNPSIRFFNAGSGDCFGDTGGEPANANSPLRPRSPYAVAKASAFWQVASYREAYHLHASTGILFNHESPLRTEQFVTRKIVATACRIAKGSDERLQLGNLSIERDWGWAPDYVEAMWAMTQLPMAEDFVVATGRTVPLAFFVERVFAELGLDWQAHCESDTALYRPSEVQVVRADVARTHDVLGWRHTLGLEDLARELVKFQLETLT